MAGRAALAADQQHVDLVGGLRQGLAIEVYEPDYGQYRQVLAAPRSLLRPRVIQPGEHLCDQISLRRSIDMVRDNERPSKVLTDDIMRGAKGRPIRPKTAGQKRYIDAIRNNVITFGLGPAGTGKS